MDQLLTVLVARLSSKDTHRPTHPQVDMVEQRSTITNLQGREREPAVIEAAELAYISAQSSPHWVSYENGGGLANVLKK